MVRVPLRPPNGDLILGQTAVSRDDDADRRNGETVFSYLKSDIELPITDAYTYLGTRAAGAVVTPLLEFRDPATSTRTVDSYPIVSIFEPTDSGDQMVVTAAAYYPATPPVSIQAGCCPTASSTGRPRGFSSASATSTSRRSPTICSRIGDRWDATTHTTVFDQGFRLKPSDVDNLISWMTAFRATANAAELQDRDAIQRRGCGVRYRDGTMNGTILPNTLTAKVIKQT